MKSEKGCPFCREDVIQIVKSAPPASEGLQVECDNCGARGPVYESKEEAIAGWELNLWRRRKAARLQRPTSPASGHHIKVLRFFIFKNCIILYAGSVGTKISDNKFLSNIILL